VQFVLIAGTAAGKIRTIVAAGRSIVNPGRGRVAFLAVLGYFCLSQLPRIGCDPFSGIAAKACFLREAM
jgi:hypothetical protein